MLLRGLLVVPLAALFTASCASGPAVTHEPHPAAVASPAPPTLPPPQPASADGRTLAVPTRRESVVDTLFGHSIADPYRWLENGESEEVRRWTEEQNALTRRVLDRVKNRAALHDEIADLLSIGTVGAPATRPISPRAARYFYKKRTGHQNQPILYVRDGARGKDEVLLDPNALSSEGTTALDWWSPSNEGRYLAYGLSQNGDEESTLYIRDVEKKKDLPDQIPRTRHASVAWLPGGKSFYYTRYPKKGSVPAGEENYHRTIYLHRVGDDPEKDAYVFGKERPLTDSPGIELSPDGRWLVVTVFQGWGKSELFLKDLKSKKDEIVPVVTGVDAVFEATPENDALYVRTNDGAPRYKLYAVDPKKPARSAWRELIPEGADVLDSVSPIGGELVATYLVDASSRVRRFSKKGEPKGDVPLPVLGSISYVSGRWEGDEAFYDFSSFAVPPTVFRLDLRSGAVEKWESIEAPFNPADFEIERIQATSKDGTPIPVFVVHKKGLVKDGRTPTVLTGYGGFNIGVSPSFAKPSYLLLLERGGILAVANLRGGGEFGEAWHQGGMLSKKQNVFDDAIAAAEKLVAGGYTDSAHLAVMGGSNGGLLVGALVTQRPDLFRAAVCQVPLLDMLRYHRFRIAKLWTAEYGSAEDPKQFDWLYAYSPYHHVKAGTRYPAVLFTTAESDSRVDPLHARKMTALLQSATGSERPVLLRVETKAGHGAGKPITKQVEEQTDVYSFLFAELDVGR